MGDGPARAGSVFPDVEHIAAPSYLGESAISEHHPLHSVQRSRHADRTQ
jgi:hypothetical protein